MRKYENFEFDQDQLSAPPASDTKIICVIPSFNEAGLIRVLDAMISCEPLEEGTIEILVVLNEGEDADKEVVLFHDQQFEELNNFGQINNDDSFCIHVIRARNLKAKFAGVGLARKIGMDEAAKRFLSVDRPDGIIASLDADVRLSTNYFPVLLSHYNQTDSLRAGNVFFEHDLSRSENTLEKSGIIQYELHLRYHIIMQKYIGLPYAYHTIGSAMSVRASAYLRHFGMNKRKAGEDFYFLHKYIKTGDFKLIKEATVFPSPRYSERVPFGTGRAVQQIVESKEAYTTYDPASYLVLFSLIDRLNEIYENPDSLAAIANPEILAYIGEVLQHKFLEIKKNTTNFSSFEKRFFQWFDAFQLIKYLHHMRGHGHPDVDLKFALTVLFDKINLNLPEGQEAQLLQLRKYERHA